MPNTHGLGGEGSVLLATGVLAVALTFSAPPAGRSIPATEGEPQADQRRFRVTAYCVKGTTASGEQTRPGVAAADPNVLPLGSVVEIDSFEGRLSRYNGVYDIKDTGAKVRGHTLDLFVPNCREARQFGRRTAEVTILEVAD
jgi:N-acetylmuramoyl-L-alanine amidase